MSLSYQLVVSSDDLLVVCIPRRNEVCEILTKDKALDRTSLSRSSTQVGFGALSSHA